MIDATDYKKPIPVPDEASRPFFEGARQHKLILQRCASWLMHQVLHPGFASEVPYNVAEVDLEEGVRVTSTIVGSPNDNLRIGMPLEVTFEAITDEVSLPKFKPAE